MRKSLQTQYLFSIALCLLLLPIQSMAKQIYDGNSSAGWMGDLESYDFSDGEIRCKEGKGGKIYTKQVYRNFVLELEFKLPPAGNNGIAIRYPGEGDPAYTAMCELQVLDNTHLKYVDLDDRQYHGSAYGMVAAKRGCLKPTGEWNHQKVTVIGSTIKVELNGVVILDTDLSKVDKYLADKPHPGKDLVEGHIGFAGHRDPVAFRNISVKKLK